MIVMTVEAVPTALRGELSRWLLEVQPGVYVGNASALVRDLLWDKVVQHSRTGRCTQMYRASNEQGFAVRLHGDARRRLVTLDGFQLVAVRNARHAELQGEYDPPEEDDKL
ncbi:type I-E CRISPR-associated endoribonuclease Cas2e [Deinococcus arenicola]|uniref:Type I-E CRISPR-associated endoribonuclease Cas2e n=1 Tax=Deinococcus arenicola TaxID=2994950 RepID=A0ABU4DV29_9DEIO|nr:type I-E CRISPR-associated endoribonuclease Cas2e [Deinococcus sp. ZS9-10]MDV6376271.1 type I-E CRISPR-associated endoribonuclease Cas2e [Deinococcus sp. ZS9-10]